MNYDNRCRHNSFESINNLSMKENAVGYDQKTLINDIIFVHIPHAALAGSIFNEVSYLDSDLLSASVCLSSLIIIT